VHRDDALPTLPLTVDPGIAPRIRVGSFRLDGVWVGDRPASLDEEFARLETRYRQLWKEPADAHDALHPARKLYHALGIDPSKTRPSSEALLRRVLLGKGLYRVNAVVDAANLASLSLLLPVGLYDLDRISPPVTLRFGAAEESYEGIRKDQVHLGYRPTLVDATGPFGNPTSDSLRTSVTDATRSVWFVLFAPPDYPEPAMRDELRRAHDILKRHACVADGG
jgi:DNA/RNA-binding domain of Phe-tRNA-synthetase-like protein